ncbi:MAG: hypothetical protein EA419_07720 [Wenzhouxiangella sp.]|nr:MAG: hypothetical protein EA419_07720 [Wenzhouxiangella sp.]
MLGLLLSHLIFPLVRWRQFDWLLKPVHLVRMRSGQRPWAVAVAVLVVALLASLALTLLATTLLGRLGWFLLALAVFVYTLGPRDLDRDVQALKAGGSGTRFLKARRVMRIRSDAGPAEAAAAVFRAAQARWFGMLFWFVVLGIPGALLYRLTRVALHEPGMSPAQADWLMRLRDVLDWPVLALMLLSAAMGGDFDRVRSAWQTDRAQRDGWMLRGPVLDKVAAALTDADVGFEDGVALGHRLVWRMLLIWLVVLSLLLIAGWLA